MNTLQHVQGTVTDPSLSATPPSATPPGSLYGIVKDDVQNSVTIEHKAHGEPAPKPDVPLPLQQDVETANGNSAKLVQVQTAQAQPKEDELARKIEGIGPDQMQVTPMSEGVSKIYEDFLALQVPKLHPGKNSSAELMDMKARVLELVPDVPYEVGHEPLRVLLADAYTKLDHYADSARMRENLLNSLETGLAELGEVAPRERLNYLQGEWAEIFDMLRPDVEGTRALAAAVENVHLGQPLAEAYAAALQPNGIVFFAEDYHALEAQLNKAAGAALLEEFNDEGRPGKALAEAVGLKNVQGMCWLAQQGGVELEDMTRMMQAARSTMEAALPEATRKLFPDMVSILVELAAEVRTEVVAHAEQNPPNAALDAPLPGLPEKTANKFGELLQHVDALFQHGYPEAGGMALQCKQALVPLLFPDLADLADAPDFADAPVPHDALALLTGMNKAVEAQHTLTQSLRALLSKAGEGHGAQGTAHGTTLSQNGAVKDALGQGMSVGIGQSLLLTPTTVRALVGKSGGMGGVNYHLAHLVLLQATAAEYGLINIHKFADKTAGPASPSTPELADISEADMARNKLGASIQLWCTELGLDDATADYAAEVAQDLSNPERAEETLARLQEASTRYTKGLSGSDDAQRAAESLRRVGGMNGLAHSIRHEMNFYNADPVVQQRRALDMYLMGFKGDLKAKHRLENAQGLTPKAGALETAVRDRLSTVFKEQEAKLQIIQGKLSGDEKQQMQDRHSALLENVHHRRSLMKHWKEMQSMADAGQELLLVRSEYAESKATMAEHKTTRKELGIRWPHQHKERQEFRDSVLSVEKFMEGKDRAALTPEDQKVLDTKLKALAGCDPLKLRRSRSKPPPAITLDTVLDIMLPKAKALKFFADYGRAHTFGDRVMGRLRMGIGHLAELHQRRHARQALGHSGVYTLRAAAEAAAIMALQASGQPRGAFSMSDAENRKAVMQQLAQWGLSSSRSTSTLTSIVNVALRKVTYKDGTLNMDKLAKHAESWARHRIFGDSKAEGNFSPYMEVRKNVLRSSVEATRAEGLSSLLEGLDAPGNGFVYEKGRGFVVDSGARFTPLGDPIVRRGTRCPLSLQIQAMRNRSVAVVKTPTGYQVLLKDKAFVSAALSGRLGLGHGLALSGTVGASGDKMEGLALDFKDSAACQRFLRDFMDHDSALHEKDTAASIDVGGEHPSWLDADQIRFLDGRGGSVNASLGLNLTLFTRFLDEEKQHALSGAASVTASAKGNFSTEVERSSQGETVTVSSTFMASVAVGLSGSLVNAGVGDSSLGALTTAKHLNAAKVQTIDITEKLKVSTDGTGLSAKTCRDYEYGGLGLRHGAFLNNLPQELRERLEHDLPTMEKLKEAQARATPMTKMSVHWNITPEALDKARTLMMQARHSAPDQSEALLHEAHALLAARSSYTPTRITIQNTVRRQVGHNYSPGLGFIKLARTNHMLRLQSEVISLANLPPVPVMNADDNAAPQEE